MENKKLMEKLADMRKNFVADRVRDKQDIVYVEEKGRALLSFRRSENRVIMSGDKARLRKIQEADPVIMDYLRNLFLGPEEDTEMEFSTDEDRVDPKMFIPKLFFAKLETNGTGGIPRQFRILPHFCLQSSVAARVASCPSVTNLPQNQLGSEDLG